MERIFSAIPSKATILNSLLCSRVEFLDSSLRCASFRMTKQTYYQHSLIKVCQLGKDFFLQQSHGARPLVFGLPLMPHRQ